MTLMQFEISVQNKPGEIARIAEMLGRNSVNIQGISTDLDTGKGLIRVITDDEATARRSLMNGGLSFMEREVLELSLPDRPGELAKMTRTLSRSGVNIESLFILSRGDAIERVAIGVNRMERAREALWKYMV
jgi:hypothetical protein